MLTHPGALDRVTAAAGFSTEPPLAVDLDGTLIYSDLLHESALKLARIAPLSLLAMPGWLASGKAVLKQRIAERTELAVADLPYNHGLLGWLRAERQAGRRLVLCTASNRRYADAVAAHLGCFDDVMASDAVLNLSAGLKAEALVALFGERGFDYVGNSDADRHVWQRARKAVLVNATPSLAAEAARHFDVARVFEAPPVSWRVWVKAMRLHQWLKNLLILLPLAGAHLLGATALLQQALVAFLAFGLCASSVYVINDLMDLESDRAHPRKRQRPFAAGLLSPLQGLALVALLLTGTVALASLSRPDFRWTLLGYFGLTLAYTFFLKRKAIIDCVTLGCLYALRIVAGWCAVGLASSFWLLAFSLFLFLSLAFVKRFTELKLMVEMGRSQAHGRAYVPTDLPLVQTMGVAAGFGSAMLLALYINGGTVTQHYSRPEVLWLLVPVQLYWIGRMWMQAQRGLMHDDPMVYTVRDRASLLCGLLFGLVLAGAR